MSSLRRVFRKSGFNILLAEGGKQGLEMLENHRVDVVISDMRMPEMDGAAFLGKVALTWPSTIRILLTGYADMESTIAAINDGGIFRYLAKPWNEDELKLTVDQGLEHLALREEKDRLLAVVKEQNERLVGLNESLEEKVKQRTQALDEAAERLKDSYATLRQSHRDSIEVFAELIKLREGHSQGHSRRIATWAVAVAARLGLDEELQQDIYFAALLHDIGELGLKEDIVGAVRNSLSPKARKEHEQHTIVGPALLMSLPHLERAASYIRAHHEYFDGSGYPDKLAGNAIPLGARIIAVVNEYDNLLTGAYSGQVSTQSEAQAFLNHNAGRLFDPDIVTHFMAVLGDGHDDTVPARAFQLKTHELREGMELTDDLHGHNGVLLLRKGQELSKGLIDKIRAFELEARQTFVISVQATSVKEDESEH